MASTSTSTTNEGRSIEKIESFINDYLREDLKELEKYLDNTNSEIVEYTQLKNTIQTIKEHLSDGFKIKMNIGANLFMQAKIENTDKILIDVGKNIFVEFTLDESLKFIEFKLRILKKEADVIRTENIKKRVDIKLGLMCIAEKKNIYENQIDSDDDSDET